LVLKKIKGVKMSKTVSEEIEEKLKQLDFEPQLKTKKLNVLFMNKWIILADGKSSHPKHPTTYVINEGKFIDELEVRPQETFAVMIAAIAIRKRSQAGDKKPQPFLHVSSMKEEKNFWNIATPLYMRTFDEYEFDAEVIGRIAGTLFEQKVPIEEIKKILIMDASAIIEKLGMKFITQSIYI
jgi:hypothetical protein